MTPAPAGPRRSRTKTLALAAIVLGVVAIGAAYASAFLPGDPPRWAAWLFAMGMTTALVATIALGALREGHGLGRLVIPFVIVTLLLVGGFAVMLGLPDDLGSNEPLLLGLPRRAAVVLYFIGLLPTLILPVAYALTFAEQTLRPEDLARVLAARDAWKSDQANQKEAA